MVINITNYSNEVEDEDAARLGAVVGAGVVGVTCVGTTLSCC